MSASLAFESLRSSFFLNKRDLKFSSSSINQSIPFQKERFVFFTAASFPVEWPIIKRTEYTEAAARSRLEMFSSKKNPKSSYVVHYSQLYPSLLPIG